MTDSRSFIEKLNPDIMNTNLTPYLSKNDLDNFCKTSKSIFTLFQKSTSRYLMQAVEAANYKIAKKIATEDPTLMLKNIIIKTADGNDEIISPLKQAIKLLDAHMWKMFLEIILGVNTSLRILPSLPTNVNKYSNYHFLAQSELYYIPLLTGEIIKQKIKNTKLYTCFLQQTHEQINQVRLQCLFDAYENYHTKYDLWYKHKITDEDVKIAWINIGMQQRNILPVHMLREFTRNDLLFSWNKSEFDITDENPPYNDAFIFNKETWCGEDLLPLQPNSGLGTKYTLVRGNARLTWGIPSGLPLHSPQEIAKDVVSFQRLYQKRTNDLSILKSQLELTPVNTNKNFSLKK